MPTPSIVWVAGGQLKGVDIDELVARVAARMRGAVLIGVDRAEIAAALARHAPQLPVVDIASTDDGAMAEAVRAAAALAQRRRHRPAGTGRGVQGHVRELLPNAGDAFAEAVTNCAAAAGHPPAARQWNDRDTSSREPAATAAPATPPAASEAIWRFIQTPPALRGLLSRPLASYYLLLASSGLLLVIGLVMVFSATSVQSYAASGNAFASVSKQGIYALVGLVAFWFAQRLPARTYQAIARAARWWSRSLLLVILDGVSGLARHGRDRQPPASVRCGSTTSGSTSGRCSCSRPSWRKLALAVWGAGVLVRQGPQQKRFGDLARTLFPLAARAASCWSATTTWAP